MNVDWNEYEKFDLKFDFIVGSDIVYDGCPFQKLKNLIDKALNPNG